MSEHQTVSVPVTSYQTKIQISVRIEKKETTENEKKQIHRASDHRKWTSYVRQVIFTLMQIVLVIGIVGIVAEYLGWQFYTRFFSKEDQCDGCAIGKTRDIS
jgi:hypothetical protein